jgi:hypothetical protein
MILTIGKGTLLPSLTCVIADIGGFGLTPTRLGGTLAGNRTKDGGEIPTVSVLPPAMSPRELDAVRSPVSAKEVLRVVKGTGLDPSIPSEHDPRWERLCVLERPDGDLRDRFRGALIGGAIGDAMGRRMKACGREKRGRGGSEITRGGMAGGGDPRREARATSGEP